MPLKGNYLASFNVTDPYKNVFYLCCAPETSLQVNNSVAPRLPDVYISSQDVQNME